MKEKLYNQEGEAVGQIDLPEEIFGLKPNPRLLHQVLRAQLANRRLPLAHTKDRGEVRGGGRKPWRQKGTGRARHGSRRSPLWVGGGVTFGPDKNRNFSQKINRKMRQRAIFMALAGRWQEHQTWFLDDLAISEPKTKLVGQIFRRLAERLADWQRKESPSILVILPRKGEELKRASRNLRPLKLLAADSLNVYDLLASQLVFVTQQSLPVISRTYHL